MDALFWVLALSVPIGTLAFEVWEGTIKPHLIAPEEIERCCAELRARYGERACELARINEDRAWRYSHSFEQGKWRRVARQLLASYASADHAVPPSTHTESDGLDGR